MRVLFFVWTVIQVGLFKLIPPEDVEFDNKFTDLKYSEFGGSGLANGFSVTLAKSLLVGQAV